MRGFREMTEVIPGLLVGAASDAEAMVLKGADVLVPLAFLDGSIWKTPFRGEIIYCPITDMDVLPDDVLRDLVDKICARMDEGKKVGLFCGAGHGRTGYVAACVLARRGIKDPIGYLRRNYSNKAVETDKQANEVFAYARSLRAEQIRKEGLGEHFVEFYSYMGIEPYIYLSFSEWDDDVAPEVVRVLNEQGFRVAYDRMILEGELWSHTRADAIECCTLFVTISTPCARDSHIRDADHSFAELLEKPIIYIETDVERWKDYTDPDNEIIVGRPSDPDFADKCLKVLTARGLVPQSKEQIAGSAGKVLRKFRKPERRWDLGVVYHEHYGDGDRMFKNDRSCNLRTRETVDSFKNELERPSDEELYRAIGWKCVRFDLFPRSKGYDYYETDEDKAFRRRLCTLGGKPVPEIKAQYDKEQKEINDYWRDYPYMDEFEYVDSRFDE